MHIVSKYLPIQIYLVIYTLHQMYGKPTAFIIFPKMHLEFNDLLYVNSKLIFGCFGTCCPHNISLIIY